MAAIKPFTSMDEMRKALVEASQILHQMGDTIDALKTKMDGIDINKAEASSPLVTLIPAEVLGSDVAAWVGDSLYYDGSAPVSPWIISTLAGLQTHDACATLPAVVRFHQECIQSGVGVALCGGWLARLAARQHTSASAQHNTRHFVADADLDLFVYGGKDKEQRKAVFERLVDAILAIHVHYYKDSRHPTPPVYVVVRGGVWSFTSAAWKHPIQVMLTQHPNLAGVLDAFDLDAARLGVPLQATPSVAVWTTVQPSSDGNVFSDRKIRQFREPLRPSRIVKYTSMGYTFNPAAPPRELAIGVAVSDMARTEAVKTAFAESKIPCGDTLELFATKLSRDITMDVLHAAFPLATDIIRIGYIASEHTYEWRQRGSPVTTGTKAIGWSVVDVATAYVEMSLRSPGSSATLTEVSDEGGDASDGAVRLRNDQTMAALFLTLKVKPNDAPRLFHPHGVLAFRQHARYANGDKWRAPVFRITAAVVNKVFTVKSDDGTIERGTVVLHGGSHDPRMPEFRDALKQWIQGAGVLNAVGSIGTIDLRVANDWLPSPDTDVALVTTSPAMIQRCLALEGKPVAHIDFAIVGVYWRHCKNGNYLALSTRIVSIKA